MGKLTLRFPHRESLWVRLLVVLRQNGRSAEALALYHHIRTRLADELGVDPGPELYRIHAELLAGTSVRVDRPRPGQLVRMRNSRWP
ncbi:BTAD domain-containing putative transcriptional regulator [Fodinicola feengrottensis]|uniref:BTAD domain-containing putative transcriptional regulator n=1 Tax=Fodinicola feengrottensis TaxID=435914 RepID=UPI00244204C9|nr:BTAD domain-containing putative transcriptional regulator [Fodinicola feengrottensis]